MEIIQNADSGKLTVTLNGRLDTVTAPELEKVLVLDGVTELVFDVAGLEYVSSAGLRLFLSAHKRMIKQGGMTISGARPVVREVFDITGFSDIFTLV